MYIWSIFLLSIFLSYVFNAIGYMYMNRKMKTCQVKLNSSFNINCEVILKKKCGILNASPTPHCSLDENYTVYTLLYTEFTLTFLRMQYIQQVLVQTSGIDERLPSPFHTGSDAWLSACLTHNQHQFLHANHPTTLRQSHLEGLSWKLSSIQHQCNPTNINIEAFSNFWHTKTHRAKPVNCNAVRRLPQRNCRLEEFDVCTSSIRYQPQNKCFAGICPACKQTTSERYPCSLVDKKKRYDTIKIRYLKFKIKSNIWMTNLATNYSYHTVFFATLLPPYSNKQTPVTLTLSASK